MTAAATRWIVTYPIQDSSTWSGIEEGHGSAEDAEMHSIEENRGSLVTSHHKKKGSDKNAERTYDGQSCIDHYESGAPDWRCHIL